MAIDLSSWLNSVTNLLKYGSRILEINKLTADDLEISLEKILSLLKNNTTAVADE